MRIKVYRFNPESDNSSYFDEFQLPQKKEDKCTAMDILRYIYENLDQTLSFYNHSACNHGICGRCAVKINGKVRLACTYVIDSDEIIIEPKNNKVVKDLVVEE